MTFQAISKQKIQDKNNTKHYDNNRLKIKPVNQNQIIQTKPICPCGGGCPGCIQAKLKVSQPDDKYEQEADRIAEQVLRMPSNQVSRKCTSCEMKEEDEEIKIHRKADSVGGLGVSDNVANEINSIRGSGSPLDDSTRDFMESRFGFDFSKVRIHNDERAEKSAESVNALAYTVGPHVVFGGGQYAPTTDTGQRLMAHELTHVVQQTAANDSGSIPIGSPDSAAEREAATNGALIYTGNQSMVSRPVFSRVLMRKKDVIPLGDKGNACDNLTVNNVKKALAGAPHWRNEVDKWLDRHLDNIRNRAESFIDEFHSQIVGDKIFKELKLLDDHFRIGDIVTRDLHGRFPKSSKDEVRLSDFQNWGNASYSIRKHFADVKIESVVFKCGTCPKTHRGTDAAGCAIPGSLEMTIPPDVFNKQDDIAKVAIVLHEAFHASFDDFSGDSYSSEGDYPGLTPLRNADSYTTFASIVATGHSYRVIVMEQIIISPSQPP